MSGPMHHDGDPACDCIDCDDRPIDIPSEPADPVERVRYMLDSGCSFVQSADVVHLLALVDRLTGNEIDRALCCAGGWRLVAFADAIVEAADPEALGAAIEAYKAAREEERDAREPLP